MKGLVTSLLLLGILCAVLLYLQTESWSILAVLAYMIGGSIYLRMRGTLRQQPAPVEEF